jgi:hypothetical protein
VADLALIEELYQALKPVLAELVLNQDAIQYFAHSVIKTKIFQLIRREEKDRYLHLIAFITHQYYQLQDNLVDVLLSCAYKVFTTLRNASTKKNVMPAGNSAMNR